MSFWGELRRRNVVKVAVAYAIVGWLLVQVASTFLPIFEAPNWVVQVFTFFVLLGFPLALLLSWAYELTPEGIKRTRQVPLTESITQVTEQRLNYVITGLVVLVLGFVVVDQYVLEDGAVVEVPSEPAAVPERATAAQSATSDTLPNSVAVLPLENLSPDPDNAYFAAGMHEEILNQLAKLRNLNVISRTSVLRYAENRPPIPQIAAELKVQAVMEGSVRYANDRVLVTVQLIDPETDLHLWSDSYPGDLSDVFAIQADIAMSVANALEAEFSEEERELIERQPTDSPVAYALYLQAYDLIAAGEASRIHALLDRAIAIDPEFAMAHGLKAWVYVQGLINTSQGSGQRWTELEPLVRESVDRALALDPADEAALLALANIDSYSWYWAEAAEAYQRAFDTGSDGAGAGPWFVAWSGRQAEAVAIADRQTDLNPLDWGAHWVHGIVLNYAGEYAAAATAARAGIELAPTLSLQHSWLAMSEVALGNVEEARLALQLAEQLLGDNRAVISLVDIAYGYGRIGDREEAQRLFDEISAAAERGQDIGAGAWAVASLATGDTDTALEWLERGAEKATRHEPDPGYYSLMNLKMNYTDDPVLELPKFVDVRNRLRGD